LSELSQINWGSVVWQKQQKWRFLNDNARLRRLSFPTTGTVLSD
jgi:hypothetical protein